MFVGLIVFFFFVQSLCFGFDSIQFTQLSSLKEGGFLIGNIHHRYRNQYRKLNDIFEKISTISAPFDIENGRAVFSTILSSILLVSIRPTPSRALSDVSQPNIVVQNSEKESLIKSSSDDRKYKAIRLKNGLRVLLVSDTSVTRSAAALDVHVGSLSDDSDVPGLAHFCEHMLFLGTKKYPQEGDFSKFLGSNGGSSNAFTASEDTVYYFDVSSSALEQALDKFAQFFVEPLFTASATARELNAIDSEHAKNINNDGFRLYQLDKETANPNHPFHKFATGNKLTLETTPRSLGIDIRERLLRYHRQFYVAPAMTLCVVGKQDLDKLESVVTRCFGAVPSPEKPSLDPALSWRGLIVPYLPQTVATALKIVPVSEIRKLVVSWPVWVTDGGYRDRLRRSKPFAIVSHLLGHEGSGSIRSYLVKRGWVNGVGAAVSEDLSDLQQFEVDFELTEKGLKNWETVVDVLFSYVDMLKTKGVPKYVFDEVAQLSKIAFEFSEKSDPADFVTDVASNMQEYPQASEWLCGPSLILDPDEGDVARYLARLTPYDAHVKLISKSFEEQCTEREQWYGTRYCNFSLPAQTQRWLAAKSGRYPLAVPSPNTLIPTKLDLLLPQLPDKERVRALKAPPATLNLPSTLSGRWTLWHKLDRVFAQPKTYAVFSMAVPKDIYDARLVVASKLFTSCFLDSISEYLYEASVAGLNLAMEFTSRGFQLVFSGFSEKMPLFVNRILEELKSFRPSPATFARFKDIEERELASWRTQQPYYHCAYYAALASETLQFPVDDMKSALDKIAVEDISSLLLRILKQSYGSALIMGNVDESMSRSLLMLVDSAFPFKELNSKDRSRRQLVKFPLAPGAEKADLQKVGYLLRNPQPNNEEENSASTFYFQLPSRRIEDVARLELLADVLEQPFYDSLRTQQQLGYIVYSGIRVREGFPSLVFTAQSSTVQASTITDRIEAFLEEFVSKGLRKLNEDKLSEFRNGAIARKSELDQRLTSQASRFWSEIISSSVESGDGNFTSTGVGQNGENNYAPIFNRNELEIATIKSLTLREFRKFAEAVLSPTGSARRLLVSEVFTSRKSSSQSTVTPLDLIVDYNKFRDANPKLSPSIV